MTAGEISDELVERCARAAHRAAVADAGPHTATWDELDFGEARQ